MSAPRQSQPGSDPARKLGRIAPRCRKAPGERLTIFFSAGEPSGDLHGANLIRQLQSRWPQFEAVGYGGPQMAAAGCKLHFELTALAVMWLARVLVNLHKFWDLVSRADRYFRHHRPDAVVLVDYPGFNWWIARRAKVHGIPVFYYAPPQIWAWAQWRVKKMRRLVDHVLCSLPFEQTWFRQQGCNATFIGHPFFDEIGRQRLDAAFVERLQAAQGPLVAILPGSRTQEVTHNLKWFLRAAGRIRRELPQARFAIAAFKPQQAEFARRAVAAAGLPVEVYVGKTPELIRTADCCMAVSGSVSLELLAQCKPTVILYWITRSAYQVQSWFRRVKYITLVNLLATDEIFRDPAAPRDPAGKEASGVLFPEYLTCEDKSEQIARHVVDWLTKPAERQALVESLEALRAEVAGQGASSRAADYILGRLTLPVAPIPRPHFAAGPARQSFLDSFQHPR